MHLTGTHGNICQLICLHEPHWWPIIWGKVSGSHELCIGSTKCVCRHIPCMTHSCRYDTWSVQEYSLSKCEIPWLWLWRKHKSKQNNQLFSVDVHDSRPREKGKRENEWMAFIRSGNLQSNSTTRKIKDWELLPFHKFCFSSFLYTPTVMPEIHSYSR